MDIAADAAVVLGCSREEILNETLPWLTHCLDRATIRDATRIKVQTEGIRLALGVAWSGESGLPVYQQFMQALESVGGSDIETSEAAALARDIAFFEKVERFVRARKKA